MTKIKNLIFVTLLILLFVEVLIVFPSRLEHEDEAVVRARVEAQQKRIEENNEPETSSLAGQKMQGVHLVESQQGSRDWELFSVSAEGSQEAGTWKLKKVKVLFYNNEKVEFTVTGDSGTIDAKTKDLAVVGHVETRSDNGYIFRTPSIYYSSTSRQIESPEQVVMRGPNDGSGKGFYLKGRHMKVLVDESKIYIHDQVSAQKHDEKGKAFEISADGAELSGKSSEAKFKGAVRVVYQNMRLEGPEASFIYKSGANILSSVSVKGGVRVSDVDKFATSESVDLDLSANKYVFKGRPRVIQNNDELTGDEIIFLEGGKKVKVEKVRAKVENINQ